MKKADIMLIIMIAGFSVISAFFIARAIFGDTYSAQATVKTIDKIQSNVEKPDPAIFNKDAINPAVRVQINGTESDAKSGTQ